MRFPIRSLFLTGLLGLGVTAHAADDDKLKNGEASGSAPAASAGEAAPSPKVRLTADLGIAHCYAGSEGESSDAADDLRTGRDLRLSAGYMVNEKMALGVLYSNFSSSTSTTMNGYNSRTQTFEDYSVDLDMGISYLGLQVVSRSSTDKAAFVAAVGLGQLSYELEGSAVTTATAKGTGLGLSWALGGEFKLAPKVALGLEINGIRGTIKDIKLNGMNLGDNDVSRIGAAAGLHLYL